MPVRFVFPEQAKRSSFNFPCKIIEAPIASVRIEVLRGFGQHIRAGITHPVDAMSESHEALSPFELGANDGFGPFGSADFEDHIERGAGHPTM